MANQITNGHYKDSINPCESKTTLNNNNFTNSWMNHSYLFGTGFGQRSFFFSRDPWKRKMTEMSVGITIISTIQYEQSKQYQWKQVIKKITKKKSHYATLPTSFNGILVKGVFFSEILRDRNARVSQLTLHKQQQTFRNNATKPWTNSSYLFWLDLVRTGGVLPRSLETERQQWQTQYSATFPQASLHGHIPFYLPLFYFGGGGGEGRWGVHTTYPCAFLAKRKTQQQHNSIHHCINSYCMRTDTHISYLLSDVFGQSCRLFSQLLGEGCTWCLFRLRFLFLFPRCTCTCSHLAGSFCIAIVCFCSIKAAAGGFV